MQLLYITINKKDVNDTPVQMDDTDSTIIEYICFVTDGKIENAFK